jgi:hypothetical protein
LATPQTSNILIKLLCRNLVYGNPKLKPKIRQFINAEVVTFVAGSLEAEG